MKASLLFLLGLSVALLACTQARAEFCIYEGQTLQIGESYQLGECATAVCEEDGEIHIYSC